MLKPNEGTIKIKWKTDPSQWELRTFDGSIITMKTVWRDDFTEWRVTDGTVSLDFKSRYTSDLGEWFAKDREGNRFAVTVTYPNDPRDWTITDELHTFGFFLQISHTSAASGINLSSPQRRCAVDNHHCFGESLSQRIEPFKGQCC